MNIYIECKKTSEVVIDTEEMNELSVVNGFSDGVQRCVAELSHLFLTEGLALLSEELGHQVPLDVPGVLRVQRPEGGQQVLVGGGQELLLEDYPDRERESYLTAGWAVPTLT